jgi:hypothetical protein
MIRAVLRPLPPLLGALLAVALVVLYLDHGWWTPALVVIGLVAATGLLYGLGRLLLTRRPYYAGFLMEAGLGLLTIAAGVAGAVLLWLAIEKAPGDDASVREKQVWAALSTAFTAYLGSLIIKPEGDVWNPVKSAITSVFAGRFTERRTELERDARDAVQEDEYGAQAVEHAGQQVSGWGWDARRLRTRHIQDQLDHAGPGSPPSPAAATKAATPGPGT